MRSAGGPGGGTESCPASHATHVPSKRPEISEAAAPLRGFPRCLEETTEK